MTTDHSSVNDNQHKPIYKIGPKARFLPAQLIQARAEALNPRNCQDLTRTSRQALYGILAFFNIRNPTEPIFASRETLCAEAMLGSQPTLYRALADLVTLGYIRREQSRCWGKSTYGQYSVSRIWLEDKALRLLKLVPETISTKETCDSDHVTNNTFSDQKSEQLITQNTTANLRPTTLTPPSFQQQPSITLRDGLLMSEPTKGKQPIQEQPAPSASTQPPAPCNSDFVQKNKKQKFNIPPELHVLQTLGLSEIRICALMKQARQAGIPNTLGVIVKTTWYRLEKLRSSALFAYLTTLIRQPKDWVSLANKKEQEQQQALQAQTEKQETTHKLRTLSKHYVGQMALHIDGRNLGVLFASGQALWLKHVEQGIEKLLPVNKSFIAAWLAGRISFTPSTVTA